MSALKRFCALLCPAPRLPESPICGNNNWYYAYGRDFDANAMLRDAHFVADIASGERIRPYCVIDAGWMLGLGMSGEGLGQLATRSDSPTCLDWRHP